MEFKELTSFFWKAQRKGETARSVALLVGCNIRVKANHCRRAKGTIYWSNTLKHDCEKNNGIITKWNFTLPANPHRRQETDKQHTMESKSVSCTPQAPQSVLSYLPLGSNLLSFETAVRRTRVLQEKQKFSRFFLEKKICNILTQFKKEQTKS